VKLIVATKNPGKLAEFEALLRDCPGLRSCWVAPACAMHKPGTHVEDPLRDRGIHLFSLADYPDMPDIPEDGTGFLENALIKARAACAFAGHPALADDSGLEVDALDGLPGILSARFAPTAEERNLKLLELMRDVPDDRRTARFVCALALVRPDGFEWTTLGVCEGRIARSLSGAGGFGYDPLFFYPPVGLTFAEIPLAEKNRISHRGRALAAFGRALREEGILDAGSKP